MPRLSGRREAILLGTRIWYELWYAPVTDFVLYDKYMSKEAAELEAAELGKRWIVLACTSERVLSGEPGIKRRDDGFPITT